MYFSHVDRDATKSDSSSLDSLISLPGLLLRFTFSLELEKEVEKFEFQTIMQKMLTSDDIQVAVHVKCKPYIVIH